MLGWSRAEAARASWMNRSLASGSDVHCCREKFQRDHAFELGVFGLIDDPHPAPADFLDDPVFAGNKAALWNRRQRVSSMRFVTEGSPCLSVPSGAAQVLQNLEVSVFSEWQRGHLTPITVNPVR